MINFGFTASTAGIGQAGNNPAGQSLLQEANGLGGAEAGFFGMLLALFARPLGTDLPAVPEGNAAQPGDDQQAMAHEAPECQAEVIVSGATGDSAPIVPGLLGQPAVRAVTVPEGDSGAAVTLVDVTEANCAQDSDGAPAEAAVMSEGVADGPEGSLALAGSHHPKALESSMEWAVDTSQAGKASGSNNAVLPSTGLDFTAAKPTQPTPMGESPAVLPALDSATEALIHGAPTNRVSAYFTNELIQVHDGGEEPIQSQTLEAFARMAESSNPLRQALPGNRVTQTTTLLPAQGVVSSEESNEVLLTVARAEQMLASLANAAPARRVEPVVTREDVENAFVFGAPQGAELASGKSATVDDSLAQTVLTRIHEETVQARAAGKTTASFEITTESGEIVRVRIAMRNNAISARIGVMDSETKEILALHIPELSQRLEMENLVPERFEFYVMNGNGRDGQRGRQRRSGKADRGVEDEEAKDTFIYAVSEQKTFEKWA